MLRLPTSQCEFSLVQVIVCQFSAEQTTDLNNSICSCFWIPTHITLTHLKLQMFQVKLGFFATTSLFFRVSHWWMLLLFTYSIKLLILESFQTHFSLQYCPWLFKLTEPSQWPLLSSDLIQIISSSFINCPSFIPYIKHLFLKKKNTNEQKDVNSSFTSLKTFTGVLWSRDQIQLLSMAYWALHNLASSQQVLNKSIWQPRDIFPKHHFDITTLFIGI